MLCFVDVSQLSSINIVMNCNIKYNTHLDCDTFIYPNMKNSIFKVFSHWHHSSTHSKSLKRCFYHFTSVVMNSHDFLASFGNYCLKTREKAKYNTVSGKRMINNSKRSMDWCIPPQFLIEVCYSIWQILRSRNSLDRQ